MKNQIQSSRAMIAKRAVACAMLALFGAVLSGCNDDKSASQDQAKSSNQADLDKHNAEIARKGQVRNQIK